MGACNWVSPIVFRKEPWSSDFGKIETGSFPGEANGVKLVLDAEVFDAGPGISDAVGFKISLLHHKDVPLLDQTGVNIDVGKSSQIAVMARIVRTSQDAKWRFEPEVRGCYFEDEIRMTNVNSDVGGRYEMANCLYQAGLDQVKNRCQCDPSPYNIGSNACMGDKITCLKEIFKEMGKGTKVHDTLTNSTKTCIAACATTSYSNVIVGSSSFPNPKTFMNTKESCIIAQKLVSTCSDARRLSLVAQYPNICDYISWLQDNKAFCSEFKWNIELLANRNNTGTFNFLDFKKTLIEYASDNIAIIKVYMKEPFVEVLIRSVETSQVDFISSVGGLLGLCMGFSFVTVAEVLFYLIVGFANLFCSGRNQNDVSEPRRINRKRIGMKENIEVEDFDVNKY